MSPLARNRKFESISLQRRVLCEPEDDIDIPVPRGSTITRCIAIVALARKLLIALSRYVIHGEIPTGAVMKPV